MYLCIKFAITFDHLLCIAQLAIDFFLKFTRVFYFIISTVFLLRIILLLFFFNLGQLQSSSRHRRARSRLTVLSISAPLFGYFLWPFTLSSASPSSVFFLFFCLFSLVAPFLDLFFSHMFWCRNLLHTLLHPDCPFLKLFWFLSIFFVFFILLYSWPFDLFLQN